MRRVVWIAVGAVGGIVAYRRVQEALADARDKGVVVSAQQVGLSAASALSSARAAAAAATSPRERITIPGSAAARVLRQAEQGE
jgi:hypothetical protein